LQIHDQPERLMQWIFRCPAHDEFFQVVVEVLLVKGRWIYRVKFPDSGMVMPRLPQVISFPMELRPVATEKVLRDR